MRLGRGETMTLAQASEKIRLRDIPLMRRGVKKIQQNTIATTTTATTATAVVVTMSNSSSNSSINSYSSSSGCNNGRTSTPIPIASIDDIRDRKEKKGTRKRKNDTVDYSCIFSAMKKSRTNLDRNVKKDENHKWKIDQISIEIFHRFYLWIFDMFITAIISTSFYVTEAEGRGSEVHYYRQSVWNRILKKAKDQIGNHFMQISSDQTPLVVGVKSCFGLATNDDINVNEIQSNKTYPSIYRSNIDVLREKSSTSPAFRHSDGHTLDIPFRANINTDRANNNNNNNNNNNSIDNNNSSNNNINININDKNKYNNTKTSASTNSNININTNTNTNTNTNKLNLKKAPAVRFVPKKSSLRPITNLKFRPRDIRSQSTKGKTSSRY